MFAGARGRVALAAVPRLRSCAVQPKVDGALGIISTDGIGQVCSMVTRGGESFPRATVETFARVRWMPRSIVVAEVEAFTEAAIRIVATRGYPLAHLFDAYQIDGRSVAGEEYGARRDLMMRAQAWLQDADNDKPWTTDQHERAHDLRSGKFKAKVPTGWRRMPVVEQRPAAQAESAWADWVDAGEAEGLVVVALQARLGARNAKRKIKEASTVDGVVVAIDQTYCRVQWAGGWFIACRTGRAFAGLKVGDVVEAKHEGFTERGSEPKFPRLTRLRPDLQRRAVCGG